MIVNKLNDLRKYLTFDKRQFMSRSEVGLYEWILKKHRKSLISYRLIFDGTDTSTAKYYHQIKKLTYYDELNVYNKQQQKNRARYHDKMG